MRRISVERFFTPARFSRRRFIGLTAAATAGLCMGCSQSDSPPDTRKDMLSEPMPDEENRFLRSQQGRFGDISLRVISEDTPSSRATSLLAKKLFEPLTGIHVEWELAPLNQVLAGVSQDASKELGRFDLVYLDQSWICRFADHTINPEELLENADIAYPDFDVDDFLPSLMRHVSSCGERLAALPFDIPIFILMYRKDIFEELRLQPPRTLFEYRENARIITEAMAPRVYGTVGQWRAGHYSLVCDMTSWLWAHGGAVYAANGSPSIADESGRAALSYMLSLGRYMPPGVAGWDWHDQSRCFAAGQAGMYISWGEFFPGYDDPEVSSVVGLAEAAPCPGEFALRPPGQCGFGESPGISHQGGSSLGISRYSKHPEAAWLFLQWATCKEITTRASLLGGGASPVRRSNYSDPRIQEMNREGPGTTRHFDVTLDAINNRMGTEPHFPGWTELATGPFAVELGRMVTGQQTVGNTLQAMHRAAGEAVRDWK